MHSFIAFSYMAESVKSPRVFNILWCDKVLVAFGCFILTFREVDKHQYALELPRQSHKTLIFLAYFANFALRDTFGGRSQRALHSENQQKSIAFISFLTPSLGPTWGTKRNIKNYKMSATLHGSAPAEKRTSPTLHGNAFAVWMVQMVPPKKASPKQPKPFILRCFERFLDPI